MVFEERLAVALKKAFLKTKVSINFTIVSHSENKLTKKDLEPKKLTGLTPQQKKVLQILRVGGALKQSDIIKKLHGVSELTPALKSSMSRTVKQLTLMGLVKEDEEKKLTVNHVL